MFKYKTTMSRKRGEFDPALHDYQYLFSVNQDQGEAEEFSEMLKEHFGKPLTDIRMIWAHSIQEWHVKFGWDDPDSRINSTSAIISRSEHATQFSFDGRNSVALFLFLHTIGKEYHPEFQLSPSFIDDPVGDSVYTFLGMIQDHYTCTNCKGLCEPSYDDLIDRFENIKASGDPEMMRIELGEPYPLCSNCDDKFIQSLNS